MPQLVKLQKELKDSGFVLIGNHVQNVDKEKVVGLLRSNRVNFTVTSFARLNVPDRGNTIPRAFLFDSKGELVEKGNPMSMKESIRKLVASEPHWLAAGRTYEKLGRLVDSMKKSPSFGSLLKKLDKEAKGDDATAKEEAEYLIGRIGGHGEKLLAKAKELESEDALESQVVYSEVAARFKGHDLGKKASDRLKELKKDKEFKKELSAGKLAYQIRAALDGLIAQSGKIDLEYAPNKKVAAKVRALFKAMGKRHAESKTLATISDELKSSGFDL